MSIAQFPAPSLALQLAELRRERQMRDRVYPHLVASRKVSERDVAYRNNALDGAIATLDVMVEAQQRGEPMRRELVQALRDLVADPPAPGAVEAAKALLARIDEGRTA